MAGEAEQQRRRALHYLSLGPARVVPATAPGMVLLEAGERGRIGVATSCLQALCRDGLVVRRRGLLCLAESPAENSGARARQGEDNADRPPIDPAESPLAILARMKDRTGRPYLERAELAAGERLRADFTHAGLTPRLGVNWQAAGSGCGNGAADLADSVVAARQRFNRALQAVGPELSGVVVDICCFLKGMGAVEAERGWPARSAKLLLKTALAALARHYHPPERRKAGLRHWGAADYRPAIAGEAMAAETRGGAEIA